MARKLQSDWMRETVLFQQRDGWKHQPLRQLNWAKSLANEGAEVFIFTDIATDGMLSGPNVKSTVEPC